MGFNGLSYRPNRLTSPIVFLSITMLGGGAHPPAASSGSVPDRQDVVDYLESHGYTLENPDILNFLGESPARGSTTEGRRGALSFFIAQAAEEEDPLLLPEKYLGLVEFVNHVPHIQYLQLKPLLFAFFFQSVVMMVQTGNQSEALEFFLKETRERDGERPFHSFHDSDLKKLYQLLTASTLQTNSQLNRVTFAVSLTETTYYALVFFLMDKNYSRFLLILEQYVKVTFVPIDHFSGRGDLITGFIFRSTDQSETHTETQMRLLENNPFDLAKKYYGPSLNFEIFDDDGSRMRPLFSLPAVIHDRVMAVASDLKDMAHLSKTSLPSCAYFTFQQMNVAYDINGSGTLLAAATERGYVKLFSTSQHIDLDDDLRFSQIHGQDNHLLVPRKPVLGGNHYATRTLIGPRAYCIRFSPDSKWLLAGSVSKFRIWSCETAAGAFSEVKNPCGIIWCADWSPLGEHFVTGSDDNCAWLWLMTRNQPIRLFLNHQEPITDVKYHPNASTIATCSYDRSVMLWDIRCADDANPCTRIFAESVDIPRVIQFARNGRVIISGDEAGKITTWDIGEGRKIGSVLSAPGAKSAVGVRDLSVSVEGTLLASASTSGEVLIWDMQTLCSPSASAAEPLRKFQPRRAKTHRVAFSNRNLLHALGTSVTPSQ